MGKELTNRQLGEALGYALGEAGRNMKKIVSQLESERKRIEGFSVDTISIEKTFRDANEAFKKTSDEYVSEMRKIQNAKPKWMKIKDWVLIGAFVLLVVGFSGISIYFYFENKKLEEEKVKLENATSNVIHFFEENTKQKEMFDKWNNR